MTQYAQKYKHELLTHVMPFWEKYSMDHVHGGFLTSLDREGKVYDTDKFMWLQGRQVWTSAMLFEKWDSYEPWKEMAIHGAEFLLKHGRDAQGDWYFALDKKGKPLVQPYNIFSDCFASMGLGALYKITGRDEYAEVARNTFNRILERRENPKGRYTKSISDHRALKGFSLPMILSNLSLELEHLLDASIVSELIDQVIYEVMEVFYQPDYALILENVNAEGHFSDTFEGRLVNPGHIIEAMWFMMDLAKRKKDDNLMKKCIDIAIRALEYGWDETYGGIYYFQDVLKKPMLQLEWDQKLWWVHLEALVCMAKGFEYTGDKRCIDWFAKLDRYAFSHFADPQYGEWFGYLNRQGDPLMTFKGGKWKGCFHVPRALFKVYEACSSFEMSTLLVK